jgi:hypothetical protein
MKTLAKLLYVEADEEITDLVDRLRDLSSEDAVTFVVPERARSLQSPMSFRLLKRYADSYGKHVNVISGEPRLQALSLEAGFSAFPNLAAYDVGAEVHRPGAGQEEPVASVGAPASVRPPASPVPTPTPAAAREAAVVSAPPRRKSPLPATLLTAVKPPRDWRPYYIVAAVVAFFGLLAGLLYLPTATVVVAVEGTPITTDVNLKGAPGAPGGTTDSFPTQAINASESQDVQDTATGQKAVPAKPASGQVTFTNTCFFCSADLPKGLVVKASSSGKRYATQKATSVDGPAGSATVAVVAVNGGADGNTDANTIDTIEGNNDSNLKVNNQQALGGGADARTATVIQQSDIDSAVKAAGDVLAPKVTQDISTKANGLHLVPVTDAPTSSWKSTNKLGDEAANFTLTVTYAQAAVAFDDNLVRQKILNALKLKLRPGYQLTSNPDTSYDVSNAAADGTITVTAHPKGYQVRELSIPGLRAYIKGRTPSSASARLYGLQDVKVDKVVIHQSPFGLPWLPFFTSRIDVQIQEVTGTAGS